LKYYNLAADQRNMGAQYELGTMYLYGEGVDKNLDTAKRFLTLASEQGYENATALLEKMKINVDGGTRKTKVSKTKYRKRHSYIRSRSLRRIVKSKSKSRTKTKRRQKK
jgi:TPR repeat protein